MRQGYQYPCTKPIEEVSSCVECDECLRVCHACGDSQPLISGEPEYTRSREEVVELLAQVPPIKDKTGWDSGFKTALEWMLDKPNTDVHGNILKGED